MGKLDNKVAIVSGASRGIGRDIAVVFAREGARVVVGARTEREGDYRISGSIDTTLERIRSEGGTAIGVRCDVTSDDEIEEMVRRTLEEFGRVDILVNNAAIYTPGTVLEVQPRHWDLSWRVNVRGPFMTCRAVLPHMIEQGGGHIINISGSASRGPGSGPYDDVATSSYPGFTVGGVSKAALDRLTQGFAHEAFSLNITVNGLLPAKSIASEGTAYHSGGVEAMHGAYVDGQIMADAAVAICLKDLVPLQATSSQTKNCYSARAWTSPATRAYREFHLERTPYPDLPPLAGEGIFLSPWRRPLRNPTNNPHSRHSRESGNLKAFFHNTSQLCRQRF